MSPYERSNKSLHERVAAEGQPDAQAGPKGFRAVRQRFGMGRSRLYLSREHGLCRGQART